MAELTIRFDVRVTPRILRWGIVGLLLSVMATELSSENVSLSTYYPAPSGVYTQILTTGPTWLARDGGSVGVGLATPAHKLDIFGGGGSNVDLNVTGRIQTGDGGSQGGVWLSNAGNMFVGQNGTNTGFWTAGAGWNALQVTQGGQVGIGTASPASQLSVAGGVQLGTDKAACTAAKVGTLTWQSSGVQVCSGPPYAWTSINSPAIGTWGGYCNPLSGSFSYPATGCSRIADGDGHYFYITSCASGWTPVTQTAQNPGSTTYTSSAECIYTGPPTSGGGGGGGGGGGRGGGGGGGGGCFVDGTPVLTPSGSVAIEKIKPGDVVYSVDPRSYALVANKVKDIENKTVTDVLEVKLSNGTILQVTPIHRFFDPRTGDYREISTFKVGDELALLRLPSSASPLSAAANARPSTADRRFLPEEGAPLPAMEWNVTIASITPLPARPTAVHNLHMESSLHNYMVDGILVHNVKPILP